MVTVNVSLQIEQHNAGMELSRQVQDVFTSVEDEFATQLKDEEINIILELVRMGRMDINDFEKTIKTSVTGDITKLSIFLLQVKCSLAFILNFLILICRDFVYLKTCHFMKEIEYIGTNMNKNNV